MENKWLMFKNYMHNELGITKEDIRQWIQESVEEQAKKLVEHEFNTFDVQKVVKDMVTKDQYFGSTSLKREITTELANRLLKKFKYE